MGQLALLFYGITTTIAVTESIVWVNIFHPPEFTDHHLLDSGSAAEDGGGETAVEHSVLDTALSIGEQLMPRNAIVTYTQNNLMGLIVFFTLVGRSAAAIDGCEPVFAMVEIVQQAFMGVILSVVKLTPIGIGSLIAKGLGEPVDVPLGPFVMLVVTAECALLCHFCILTCGLRFVALRSPLEYLKHVRPAIVMAFGTDSSAATLPVSMSCAHANLLRKRTIDFVFPLGATVRSPDPHSACASVRKSLLS